MYITWRTDHLTHAWINNTYVNRDAFNASLSESKRVDGKPRRRVVANLGHIETARVDRAPDQAAFWFQAERGLTEAGIVGEERGRFVAELIERIPRPDFAVLADPLEWRDLVLQSADAALSVLPFIPIEDEERDKRHTMVNKLRHLFAERDYLERWMTALTREQNRKHDDELRAYIAVHPEVTGKRRFDYSKLDPETAAKVEEAATAIKQKIA